MDNCRTELYHHGIKGQKWGIRRYQNYDGSLIKSGNKRKMTADQKAKKEMINNVRNRRLLSDADLKRQIDRIQMQRRLKELTEEEIAPGRKFIKDIIYKSGKSAAIGGLTYAGKAILTKKFNLTEAAGYMFPKPKK